MKKMARRASSKHFDRSRAATLNKKNGVTEQSFFSVGGAIGVLQSLLSDWDWFPRLTLIILTLEFLLGIFMIFVLRAFRRSPWMIFSYEWLCVCVCVRILILHNQKPFHSQIRSL